MNPYHNTTDLFGNDLATAESKAITQKEACYEILKEYKSHATAPEVWAMFIARNPAKKNTPLTSIRRALSDLCNDNKAELVKVKKQGIFGISNYQYRII